jgi:iron complex outermembrane recepter protein
VDVKKIQYSRFRASVLGCTVSAACTLGAPCAFSLESADAASASSDGTLDEIIITAERREEKLDKVPISVTAFSQRTLDDLHIENLADLATIVPGLDIQTNPPLNQDAGDIAIRGIFSGGNAPTTQIYIDETPVAIRQMNGAGLSVSPYPNIFDLDRIEVLRGPQGTLFGASAMGGAIRFITPQPSLNDASGFTKADISYTDGGSPSYELGAAYGAPIVVGSSGFRVSAWFQSLGGFIDHEDGLTGQILTRNANWVDSYVVRPAFTWSPAENLSVTASVFLQHKHDEESQAGYWATDLPNPETNGKAWGSGTQPLTDDLRVSSLAIKYDVGGIALQSDTSYLDRGLESGDDWTHQAEAVFGGTPFLPSLNPTFAEYESDHSSTNAWQQEFRLSSQDPSSRVSWVAGLYYRHAVEGLQQFMAGNLDPLTEAINGKTSLEFFGGVPNYVLNGQSLNSYTNFHTTDISEAAFGDLTINIVSGLKANLGVRAEHSIVEHQTEIVAGPLDGVTFSNTVLPDQVGNPITPKFGLTYQYTEDDMVYVSAAKGYRPGGGNAATSVGNALCGPSLAALGLTSVPTSFNSDSLWSYEIGAKDSLFNRRLAIQASVYYIDWTDIQTSVGLPSCGEAFTANRGKAVSQGFDLQVAANIAEGLKARALVGYTDAYNPNAAHGAPSNGIVPLLNGAGDKLPLVLPWTAAANIEYSRDISPLWGDARSYLRLDYRWLSAANSLNPNVANYDPETGPYQNQAYGILNIRLGVVHEGLDVSAYVNNATQSDPRLGYQHDSFGSSLFYGSAIRPLTAGFTAWYRF